MAEFERQYSVLDQSLSMHAFVARSVRKARVLVEHVSDRCLSILVCPSFC